MRNQVTIAWAALGQIATAGAVLAVALSGLAQSVVSTQAAPAISITLEDAIRRAAANEPGLAASHAEQRAASLGPGIVRASLLPQVTYHNQALYTEPNGASNGAGPKGSQPAPIFIANNAVREYASQALITETLSVAQLATLHAANASSARAAAELEVARRGLVAATAGLFFGLAASERKLIILRRASEDAADFVALTEKREAAREVAHADVIKAQLTAQGTARALEDGVLARDRARLELAMLLFADPLTPFALQAEENTALPTFAEIEKAAMAHNPMLAGALAALQQSDAEVLGSKGAYLPDLALNFNYGIDATTLATKAPFDADEGRNPRNLGYSIAATIDIPVWDWFSTERRVRQSEIRRDAVRVALTAAQKRLIVDLKEDYAEAQAAQNQIASLEETARTAEESLRLTRLRYSSGEATALEVVDAETTLYSAQTAQEDGRVRYEQALSSLQILTGAL